VETLWSCHGAQGSTPAIRAQRHPRDVLAINQHFSFNFDTPALPTACSPWAAVTNPTM
jgi:hypothetical protein